MVSYGSWIDVLGFEKYVKDIWMGLNDENISSNMYEISEIKPHFTVAAIIIS
jgi:hypothetical protein